MVTFDRPPPARHPVPVPHPGAVAAPRATGAQAILRLQPTVGNAATTALLSLQRGPPPAAGAAAATGEAVKIGYVYTIRGTVDGKAVVYTGSTTRELIARIYKDPHTWRALARESTTTIDVSEIT